MCEIPSPSLRRCATIALFERYEGSAELDSEQSHESLRTAKTDPQGREIVLSTPIETENDFVDETVENVQQGGTTSPVAPGTTPEQPEHQPGHEHHHHTHETDECSGGGCADAPPA